MNDGRTATASAATRVGSGAGRLIRAWRSLPHERRLAAYAAIGLFLSLFLPWYQRQFFVVIGGKIQPASDSQTAWGAFSFVEAAILLVSVGVLVLLFQRAEGKAFHLPGGDGGVITAAGVWSAVLIVWRIFDKQGGAAQGQAATSYGIEWGIFIALAIAVGLILAGSRIRAAHRPEPPLPGEDDAASPVPGGPLAPAPPRLPLLEARIVPPEPGEDATLRRASAAAPTPVPVVSRAPAASSPPGKGDGRGRTSERESVEFVPAEPSEYIPRRGPAEPSDASRAPGERQRGWLTARPSHLAAKPPAPVPADAPGARAPGDDTSATVPAPRREPSADDTAATLPAPRRKQPPDHQLTIPLEHDD